MTKRRGQDDLARRLRLNEGRCPTHGCGLVPVRTIPGEEPGTSVGLVVECPRRDCDFAYEAREGSKCLMALHENMVSDVRS